MNRGARKVRGMTRRTDLRNDEVDGHLVAKRMREDFRVGEEGASSEILELLDGAAAERVKLELWDDVMGKECLRRNYL